MDVGLLQTGPSTTPIAACVLIGQLAAAALATASSSQPPPHPPPPPRVLPPSPFKPTVFAPAAPWFHSRGAGDSSRPAHSGNAASAADAGLAVPLQPRPSPPRAPRPSSFGEVPVPCASSTASPAPFSATKAAPRTRLRSLVVGSINGVEVLIEGEGACCGLSREGLEEEDDRRDGWVLVGPRRRPPDDTTSLLPRRLGLAPSEGELAFKRRMRGLCFRCLSPCSPRHFARICRGPVRCLTCRRSGHVAKECQDRLAIDIACAAAREAARPKPSPARRTDGRSWAAVAAPPGSVSVVSMQKTFIEEQVTLMRAELSGLVTSKLEEMVAQLAMKDSVRGLLERFGSFLERAETAFERLSMAPTEVLLTPAPPPAAGVNDGCMDGSFDLYGCFSPKKTTNPESILALVSECVTMQDMPSLQERVGVGIPSHEEQIARESVLVNDEGSQERVSPGLVGELSHEHATLQTVQGEQEAEQQINKDIISPMQAGSGQIDLSDFLAQVGSQDSGCADVSVTHVDTAPISVEEFLKSVTRVLPSPILGTPLSVQAVAEDVSRTARRSGRLDTKNKSSNVPTSKRAEFRLMEAFGELPEMNKDEAAESKIKSFRDMCKKPLSSQAIAAIHDLVGISGKAKMNLKC